LAGITAPIAGATGATIQQEITPAGRAATQSRNSSAAYSIQFVQHAPEPLITPNKTREENYVHHEEQPQKGFAIKKASGKRVTFTMEQKEVMIQFYDRQANQGIWANPKDVIEVMKQHGMEPLKESQIRSWWSSYHQKRRNAEEVTASSISTSSNEQSNISEQHSQPTEPTCNVMEQLVENNINLPQRDPVPEHVTSNIERYEEVCHQPSPERQPQDLQGTNSPHTPVILEWNFPVELSQSTINGRMGSNACTFIALKFGHLYFVNGLQPPVNSLLQNNWKVLLIEAILNGNEIHDDIFEGDAVNIAVDEAIEIAGDEFCVDKIDCQYDIIGSNRVEQLKDVFKNLAVAKVHIQSCHVIVTCGRSMLLIINGDGSSMIMDSHQHKTTGAIIAFAPAGQADSLALWFARMHRASWETDIGSISIVSVCYC